MLNPNVHYVKIMRGSTAAWEKLKQTPERISDDTLYFVYDPANKSDKIGKAYLGQKLLSGVGEIKDYIAIEDLGNVLIDQETLADKDILVYDSELGEWKNATLDEVIADWAAEAEAWAMGQKNGIDVPPEAPQYHNNAKYYAENARLRWSVFGDNIE